MGPEINGIEIKKQKSMKIKLITTRARYKTNDIRNKNVTSEQP